MSLENRINHYKEMQAEDFDMLESAKEHAERLGLGLYDLRLDKDGRILETRFLAYIAEGWEPKDTEEVPEKKNVVVLNGATKHATATG